MPAYTQEQAQQLYGTLTAEQKAAVDASGGPSVAWFTNAVNAGVPSAVQMAGGKQGAPTEAGYGAGGYSLGWQDAAEPSEWLGKRKPTPAELRKWAAGQHAGYVSGNRSMQDEDYERFPDHILADQIDKGWNAETGGWNQGWGAPASGVPGQTGGGGGGGGVSGGGGGRGAYGGGGTYGGAPAYTYGNFKPPSYADAMKDPGYQFAVGEGQRALEGSAAARGVLRSSGTLKDLVDYGQQAGAQQYQNVYNREANTYGLNRETERDRFAPRYGSWQTQYGGNLQKYLQRENNIYGLINTPPWGY